jgi:Family of unknown function (DUF6353)
MYNLAKLIPNALSSKLGRQILVTQKNSPTILFVGGVVGVVATTVLASKATLKLTEVLDEQENNIKLAENLRDTNAGKEKSKYTDEDYSKDVIYIHARTVVAVTKLYAPALIVGAVSIAALTGSHKILTERNASLMAAYAALDKGFAEYRKRVAKEFGPDVDKGLLYPGEERKAKSEGSGKDVKVWRAGPDQYSPYARFFDQFSRNWEKTPEYNFVFLRCQQNYANDLLRSRGHVFLNDVYDMLGIERSRTGAVVGWVIGTEGDNYIDFGIFNGDNARARDFVNGREGSILLDFNVDGVIYDKI